MNRLYRTIVGILTSTAIISIYAADYVPMIREGRVWEYTGSCGVSSDPCHAYHYMKFDGTADVNGTEYHRFVQFKTLTVGDNDGKIRDRRYGDIFVYYLREDEGKVYFLYDSGNGAIVCQDLEAPDGFKADGELKEFKVYDFTLTDGETWNYPHYLEWRVPGGPDETGTQTVRYEAPRTIGGETCRVMSFRNLSVMGSEDLLKFIEGIGTTVNGCLVNPSLGNISGVVNNSMSAGVQSCLNRVFDAEGNVIYAQENTSEPPVNDGYVQMIDEGKVWEYEGYFNRNGESGQVFHYMKFDGTVSVNGMEYHEFGVFNSKFYRHDNDSDPAYVLSLDEERDGPVWFLREEAGKVFALTSGDLLFESEWTNENLPEPDDSEEGYGEILLYDFTLEEGDQMIFPEWGVLGYENVKEFVYHDPVVIEGDLCKVQEFKPYENYMENPSKKVKVPYLEDGIVFLVEGIGVTFNGCLPNFYVDIYSSMHENNSRCPGSFSSLRSVRNASGDVIYGLDSPAGLSGFTVDSDFDMITYDVLGRRVRSTVPGGVYIRGGKKFVAK